MSLKVSKSQYKWHVFWPTIPDHERLFSEIKDSLSTRWIGQGPKTEKFEQVFKETLQASYAVAVNSGTSALHLAYILAGIKPGDKVISPVFTCTATNHALLYQGAEILFNDVDLDTLCSDAQHARRLCEEHPDVKAIVAVHIAGNPCLIHHFRKLGKERGIPIIYDAAQALDASYGGKSIDHPDNCGFATCHSFQAIKPMTTGDGGMLVLGYGRWDVKGDDVTDVVSRAKRLRWFGIDRDSHRDKGWQPWAGRGITNDQYEVGYKYQMTDLDACWGLVGLMNLEAITAHRMQLSHRYRMNLQSIGFPLISIKPMEVHPGSSCSMFGVFVSGRDHFCEALASRGVETNVVQVRNDKYSVFKKFIREDLPNMDSIEDRYVYLPLHSLITLDDVDAICVEIAKGW